MLYKKEHAQKFSIPGGTEGILFPPSPRKDQSIAIVDCKGTYPEKGWSINSVCTETIYLLEGSLLIECDGERATLLPGDLFVISPGQKYRIIGEGKSVDFITPAWDKEQNKIIDY
jgi:mannose-6-phosphate isomerase-like protein (cupin superfamily)